ncbi:MAG TPA: GFA family protein [Polyangiaceae bacterium]|jgi:hypothetical protein|nr:GFA family protein [Polyangiaceae bacterium]
MADTHEGGCLCGDIRYKTSGEPAYQAICHCRFCQQLSGSAFHVVVVFDKPRVEFSGKAFSTYPYRSPDHGRVLTVQFCPRCGTRLGLNFERFPTFQSICGGTFDDPSWFKVDRHIFTSAAVNWMVFPEGVDLFDKHSLTLDGGLEEPLPR